MDYIIVEIHQLLNKSKKVKFAYKYDDKGVRNKCKYISYYRIIIIIF